MAASEQIPEPRSWLGLVRELTSDLEQRLSLAEDPASRATPVPSNGATIALVLIAQAYVAWAASGLGSFARAGLSWAAYGAVLAQQLAAIALEAGGEGSARNTAIRTLLDESVAQLRELGELSVQEARALQRNLLALAEQLRDLDANRLDEPQRHAKVKR